MVGQGYGDSGDSGKYRMVLGAVDGGTER
jgi:hypothetical protein